MHLKHKSQALDAFKLFKAATESQLDVKIKELQDNKRGEYMSTELAALKRREERQKSLEQ